MKKNLVDYIFRIKDFLNEEERYVVIEELQNAYWKKHEFSTNAGKTTSYDDDLEVLFDNLKSTQIIMPKIWNGLKSYYDHYNFSWFKNWNGYTQVRYNRYSVGQSMHLHWDGISSMFDGNRKGIPTLTILGLINDDYGGGEFVMFDEEKEFEIEAGEVIIFPSNFLYPHYVKTVIKGTRYSFVSWTW